MDFLSPAFQAQKTGFKAVNQANDCHNLLDINGLN